MVPRASTLLLVLGLGVAACNADSQPIEGHRATASDIVGGTKSTAAQDGAVLIIKPDPDGQGFESCTGSLIAPNLVLTARHCVADPDESTNAECVGYGPTTDPGNMELYVGRDLSPLDTENLQPDAVGINITVPKTMNMCGFDVALIQLDSDLTQAGATVTPLRFTPLADNEPTIAVGYGVGGGDNDRPGRMQRQTTVLGVGPKSITYQTTGGGAPIPYNIPQGDIATGESTCYGDSGGPLFDTQGNVVGVTSRGIDVPDDGTHGNGCVDAPSVYAGVRFNEPVIRAAAQAAGHPLPAAAGGKTSPPAPNSPDAGAPPTTGPTKNPIKHNQDASGGAAPGDDDDDDLGAAPGPTAKAGATGGATSAAGDDDDDGKAPSKGSTAPPATRPASTGCSAAAGAGAGAVTQAPAGSWLPALGLGLALVMTRRRRAAA
jgi:hypothetical protein